MPDPQRGHELIEKYLDGRADVADLAELEALLAADPAVAEAFAEGARLQAGMERHFRQQAKMDAVADILQSDEIELPARPPVTNGGSVKPLVQSTFVPHPVVLRHESPRRPRPGRPHWKPASAVALLVLLGIAVTMFWRSEDGPPRLISGRLFAAGKELREVPEDTPFQVAGDAPAVIRLSGGALVKLFASTRAMLRRARHENILLLTSGRGEFTNPEKRLPLRVETDVGAVVCGHCQFSLELATQPAGSNGLLTRSLAIQVSEGALEFAYQGEVSTLSAPDRRVFMRRA